MFKWYFGYTELNKTLKFYLYLFTFLMWLENKIIHVAQIIFLLDSATLEHYIKWLLLK